MLKSNEPGTSTGGQLFSSQAGAPRLRPSRLPMLSNANANTHPPRPRGDDARGRYTHINTDSFSEEFYHGSPRRAPSRLAALSAYPVGIYKASVTRFGRRRGPALLCFCCLALFFTTFAFHKRFVSKQRTWPVPFRSAQAVAFGPEELRKIWEWEVLSGHYPSTRPSGSFYCCTPRCLY